MKKAEYARMAHYERTYWWHLGRIKIIRTYLKLAKKSKDGALAILNVGCGTGGAVDVLEKFGVVDNVDVSDDALNFMKKSGYKRLTKVDDIELPFTDGAFDIVGAFDVLEHIDKHVDALKEWKRVLKNDGVIVLTVPAYQWLWSDHDVSLHHKRRYTVNRLKNAAYEAGLEVEKGSYAIVFSLPMIVGFRFLNRILRRKTTEETSYVSVSAPINKFFTNLLGVEAWFHKWLRFPTGTSVVAILRKADE